MSATIARGVNAASNQGFPSGRYIVRSSAWRLRCALRVATKGATHGGSQVIADALAILKTGLELFGTSGAQVRQALLQAFFTAALVSFAYVGAWTIRENYDLRAGFAAAFPTRQASSADDPTVKAAVAQYELRAHATSDLVISHELLTLLGRSHGGSRVRLAQIHNGVTGITGSSILKYDITNGVAEPGRAVGDLVVDQPLSEWTDFLQVLISEKCAFRTFADVGNFGVKARLAAMHVQAFLACPVVDPENRMLGAVFINWADGEPVPKGVDLDALETVTLATGREIAVALDVRPLSIR